MKRDERTDLKNKSQRMLCALELRWRKRWTKDKNQFAREVIDLKKRYEHQIHKAEDEAAEAVRRVSRISYRQDRQHGIITALVSVPALELAYARDYNDQVWEHMARHLGRMLEIEFKQLNMATLAQSIRAAEERQRRIDEQERFHPRLWAQ
jgi:hypothetical protein